MKLAGYGKLLAEHYDLKYPLVDGEELEWWLRHARAQGGAVLELGCGTGRVLVPLLERGVEVVGIDTSEDMLARLRARCEERGLVPEVHLQAMQELRLDRRFEMIFVASCTLGLVVEDAELDQVLERVWEHLEPGGLFLPEIESLPDPGAMARRGGVWQS